MASVHKTGLRSAPSYADGRIFVTTLDNMTLAFSASTGVSLWSHNGMIANAALLGAASPAIKNNKLYWHIPRANYMRSRQITVVFLGGII